MQKKLLGIDHYLFPNKRREEIARKLYRSFTYRHLVGPGILFGALMGALVEFGFNLDFLSQPGLLLSDYSLMRKAVMYTGVALAGLKAHHTFSYGDTLVDRYMEPHFRKSELLWWAPIMSAISLSLWEYPNNLWVFLLFVLPLVAWEIRRIAVLKKHGGSTENR